MDEGRIVLVGNDSDILHCGYSHAISDAGKRYPSVDHYAHSMILSQLGLDEAIILELLSTSTRDVPSRARSLLQENMPRGHDMKTLAGYLSSSRLSYTMAGLRIRAEQDPAFERALMATKEALLVVCDARDPELGIGMDEQQFVEWMNRERVDAQQISHWMRDGAARPPMVGQNQLGYFLMYLRLEVRNKKRALMLTAKSHLIDGLSTDQNEKAVRINVNDLVISLSGVFRPLSNYYPLRFEMKGDYYRSVEHYAYEKLFMALKLDDKLIEKITTTVLPTDVAVVAQRIFLQENIPLASLESKLPRLDRWRQSAMKHKLGNSEYLQQLLLSTGDALLVDNAYGDPRWTCGASEAELQHLLTKSYVDADRIVGWMRGKVGSVPRNVSHLIGNTAGLLLMELRSKLADNATGRIPLISTMNLAPLASQVSHHVICFTPESVWHPLYPAEICPAPGMPLLPSPAHYVAQQAIKWLAINKPDAEYIMETRSSIQCWQRLHDVIESVGRGLEKESNWWMNKRQQAIREALTLLFEQHPPLLRALLDTEDALLVYCVRFSSIEAELSVGMRERDLRAWLCHVDVSTKQLLELCSRPMAFRPAYLGGNRLGFMLMELRREFVLRGVFPQQLPDLGIGPEAILGSESPTENLMVGEPFDVMALENFTALAINPLMLLAKQQKRQDLMTLAVQTKVGPRLVSLDDERITGIVDDLDSMAGKVDQSYLSECAPEELRAVFMRLSVRVRGRIHELDAQQSELAVVSREVSQMQVMRRSLEEARAATMEKMAGEEREMDRERLSPPGMPIMQPPIGASGGLHHLHPRRALAGSERDGRFEMGVLVVGGGRPGSLLDGPLIPPPPRAGMPRRQRSPFEERNGGAGREGGIRKIRGDLIPAMRTSDKRRGLSPRRGGLDREMLHHQREQQQRQPLAPFSGGGERSPLAPLKRKPPKSPSPPPVPKVKVPRPADEELSDGEIVDSD